MQFLDIDWKTRTADQFYMAQIAAEVRRGQVKKEVAEKLAPDDFLLEFTTKTGSPSAPPQDPNLSKTFWFAACGLKKAKE